jgi:hypothetical protein
MGCFSKNEPNARGLFRHVHPLSVNDVVVNRFLIRPRRVQIRVQMLQTDCQWGFRSVAAWVPVSIHQERARAQIAVAFDMEKCTGFHP